MSKHIVEINGVKMEVDSRHAKVVHENLKVGSKVKVLYKEYDRKKVGHGVIVGFDMFKDLPTINVLYVEDGYSPEVKLQAFNQDSKDFSIVPDMDDTYELFDKERVIDVLDRDILKKEQEVADVKAKKEFFLKAFGHVFGEEQ